jgi:hypothetical protein
MNPSRIFPALLCLFLSSVAGASQVAGHVELVEGVARIYDASGKERVPALEEAVHEGDTVVTGADGEVHLRMEDQALLALRPNTRLKIQAYRAEGGAEDRSFIALFKGTYRVVTGWIGKLNKANYRISTPSATIGIRGTDHEPAYLPEGEAGQGERPGTYDKVNEGETFIETPRGRIFIRQRQSGFVHHHGKARPQLLKRIPRFFKGSLHEKVIEKRKEALRSKLSERLKQRREEAISRRKAALEKIQDERERRAEERKLRELEESHRREAESSPDVGGRHEPGHEWSPRERHQQELKEKRQEAAKKRAEQRTEREQRLREKRQAAKETQRERHRKRDQEPDSRRSRQ